MHDALLGEPLEVFPAEIARHLLGCGHDGAAVARMGLDHLAHPFRIEQVAEALRRVLSLDQARIVADDDEPHPECREHPVRILVLILVELGDILRHERLEDAVALPDDEVRRIRGIDGVDRIDAARIFLTDALEHALGASPLDPHRNAGKFRLERLGDPLGDRQIDRGVVDHLAFLLGRLDQLRRDRSRRWSGGQHLGRRHQRTRRRNRGRCLEHVAP